MNHCIKKEVSIYVLYIFDIVLYATFLYQKGLYFNMQIEIFTFKQYH